ncbi:MAG: glycosylhydrolase-like jelly roll fold domain-containing protein, partial [Syntrophobacteraceae bacterium]
ISWSEHADAGVKYFSGKATYRKQLQVPPIMLGTGRSLCLDLGEVQVMASVKLNGKNLGTLWKPPFRVDITGATRAGDNLLEITVVNLWPNRLIGDANLPDDCEWNTTRTGQTLKAWPKWLLEDKPSPTGRFTFSILRVWPKDAPLLKSGLLGPVTLHVAARVT